MMGRRTSSLEKTTSVKVTSQFFVLADYPKAIENKHTFTTNLQPYNPCVTAWPYTWPRKPEA
jgi:hypothetical protein